MDSKKPVHKPYMSAGVFLIAHTLMTASMAADVSPNLANRSQDLREAITAKPSLLHTWPKPVSRDSSGYSWSRASKSSASIQFLGTNNPGAAEPLMNPIREEGQLQLSYSFISGRVHGTLTAQARYDTLEDDEALAIGLDGTNLGIEVGNWDLSLGVVDRWWGPAWQSPLILSNNARPIPALSLDRIQALAPDMTLLRWIGPWRVNTFLGQLESDRVIPNALIWGFRVSAMPYPNLELGLNRTALFGGDGRTAGLTDLANVVLGRDNDDDQPGNQLGGFDISYRFEPWTLGQTKSSSTIAGQEIYLEIVGEDEANAFPAKKFFTVGTAGFVSDTNTQGAWHYLMEYSDTTAGSLESQPLPNITYEHHIYRSGYTHHNQVIGSPLAGDTKALTLGIWRDQSLSARPHHQGVWLSQKKYPEAKVHQVTVWSETMCAELVCRISISGFDQPMKNQTVQADGERFALSLGLLWRL